MGLLDFFVRLLGDVPEEPESTADEEEQVFSSEDMVPYIGKPFLFCGEYINAGPGCFDPWRMTLAGDDIYRAMDQIGQLNEIVQRAYLCSDNIPLSLSIPEDRIDYSASHIVCTPRTKTGKESKFPFSLFFMTDRSPGNETTGRIDYFPDGTFGKAKVSIWRDHVLYSLSYKTVGRSFVLGEVKTNAGLQTGELPCVIYKA